jgi:hypothetical protein
MKKSRELILQGYNINPCIFPEQGFLSIIQNPNKEMLEDMINAHQTLPKCELLETTTA